MVPAVCTEVVGKAKKTFTIDLIENMSEHICHEPRGTAGDCPKGMGRIGEGRRETSRGATVLPALGLAVSAFPRRVAKRDISLGARIQQRVEAPA
jgi:hypothetical protein